MATGCSSRFDNFRRQCIGSERPKLKDLYKHVTPCYAAQWEDIGVYLDIELGHLQTIKADHPGDTSGCCKDLWKKWLELDPNATWEKLFTAIDDCTAASSSTATAGIHSTTTSEPPTKKMRCSPLDVSRLKARYIKHLSTDHTDWSLQYVRLALVKGEKITRADKNLEEITRLTLQGQVDELLLRKEPLGDLRDIFHYKNTPCPRLILIMGGPGIGKTTLANELCVRWARDGFLAEDFDAVVLIPLRSVQQRSLKDVTKREIGKENYQEIKKSSGSRCLIILEGLDEIPVDHQQSDPFLIRLIKECNKLEKATILITSRPHACKEIDAGRRVEVVGFGNDEIREFVEKSFPQDVHSVQEFLWQLDEYPQLRSLCYIPMNLVMIVDIFQCNEKKLPSTLTELYQVFIVMTLKRQVKKENVTKKPAVCSSVAVRAADGVEETLCVMLRGIPKETVGIVLCLSRLAYRGFFGQREDDEEEWKEPKIIFTESDLIQCDIEIASDFDGFGLLKATQTHQLLTDINTYSFNHLSIQEYFCALYISLQFQQEQLCLLREHFHEYPNVFTYVCGLTGLASIEMFQFVYSKLTSPGGSLRGDPDVITAMRCINESKQSSGPHQSVSPFTLNMTENTLLPYDCLCLSNVLSCYPVSKLLMEGCYIGNKGAELLVKHYTNKNTTSQLLEELVLSGNDLTSEGMEHVMKIVRTSSSTLRVLNVSHNDIGDDWMAVISEALQHNKSLTTLRVESCGLSVKGAVYISQLLNVTHTLQELDMSHNDIGDDVMAVISEALQHNKSFTTLGVGDCGLSVKGVVYISQLLNVTHTLQELIMSLNDIGDDGMAIISEALQHNKSFTTLGVVGCGLSVKGAISISKMMMVNHSLQVLYMTGNNIGDDGISAIAGALGNCKIVMLGVQECGITLTGATSLAASLLSNHTITELRLDRNPITIEGALLIVKSAVDNTVCQHVKIDDEYKSDEIKKMMNILEDRVRREYDIITMRKRKEVDADGKVTTVFKGSVFVEFKEESNAAKFIEAEELKYKDSVLLREFKNNYIKRKKQEENDRKKAQLEEEERKKKEAQPKVEYSHGHIMKFVGCGENTDREKIKAFFTKYATVLWVEFSRGETEGYVRFQEEDGAQRAVDGAKADAEDGKVLINGGESQLSIAEGEDEKNFYKRMEETHSAKLKQMKGGGKGKPKKRQRENTRNKPNKQQKADNDSTAVKKDPEDEADESNTPAADATTKEDETPPSPKRAKQEQPSDHCNEAVEQETKQHDNNATTNVQEES